MYFRAPPSLLSQGMVAILPVSALEGALQGRPALGARERGEGLYTPQSPCVPSSVANPGLGAGGGKGCILRPWFPGPVFVCFPFETYILLFRNFHQSYHEVPVSGDAYENPDWKTDM